MVGHALADYELAGAYIKWTNITIKGDIRSCKHEYGGVGCQTMFLFAKKSISCSLKTLQAVDR
jgi:hypothetical protein